MKKIYTSMNRRMMSHNHNTTLCALSGRKSSLHKFIMKTIIHMKDQVTIDFNLQNYVVDDSSEYFKHLDMDDIENV